MTARISDMPDSQTLRGDFAFVERLRVRRAEVDAQQVVFNAHYLSYFDLAFCAYWRALALPYVDTMKALGAELFVRKASLEYESSARYDEQLEVGMRCLRIGNSSLQMQAAVFRDRLLLVRGEMVYVFADVKTQTSQPLPASLRALIEAFESGQPVLDLRVGSWAELGAAAGAIRQAVFVEEQKIPADMEWDSADEGCVHAVAFNRLGVALGTGRLLPHVPGVAKIGRMAVLRDMRGGRIGGQVLQALMSAARTRGDREVMLHAQLSAAAFYARAGFVPRGAVFEEAGIAHVEMVKAL